jgi:hypothetical protein
MRFLNEIELANTRRKLAELEAHYEARRQETSGDVELRELSMESFHRLINQLKEEIIRSEIHASVK